MWLPHGKVANSPGHPAWDLTGGKFGPYKKQMFLGDQTMSNLFRVTVEKVKGMDQGCVVSFARFFASGVMRPVFLPDGSLLIGQTGRGWGAFGGQQASLQRIIYDGKTIAAAIHRVNSAKDGFMMHFTQPISDKVSEDELAGYLKVQSWFYTNTGRYGSPEHDKRADVIERVQLNKNRKSVLLKVKGFGDGDKWLNRIYHIHIPETKKIFGDAPVKNKLASFFTLRATP